VLWQNPKPSVQALIIRGGDGHFEILLGQRAEEPPGGLWDTPGGFLNVGDEPEAALVRECQREYGVLVGVHELIAAVTDSAFGPELALFYRCEIRSGEPRPADIVDAVSWFSLTAPPRMAYKSDEEAIRALQVRCR
jgi:ADP-ribose pyrophosphatase YjhB (NUDIX family)